MSTITLRQTRRVLRRRSRIARGLPTRPGTAARTVQVGFGRAPRQCLPNDLGFGHAEPAGPSFELTFQVVGKVAVVRFTPYMMPYIAEWV